jgi:hypothetical protein
MASFSRRLGSASFTKPTVPEKQPSAERRRPYRLGRRDCPVRGGSPGEAPIDFSQEGHGASQGQRVGSEPHPGALACLGVGGHAPSLAMACLASAIDVTQEADPSHSARKPRRDNFRAGVFASSYTRLASDGELMNSLECHRDAVSPSNGKSLIVLFNDNVSSDEIARYSAHRSGPKTVLPGDDTDH